MKAELQLKEHPHLLGEKVIEVFWNGELICTVTGADGPGVRIISKHSLKKVNTVGALEIQFDPGPT